MADYNDIKQSIATNLPDNNNREITASKLRDTLNKFVDKVETTETGIEENTPSIGNTNENVDLDVCDKGGNVILRLENGHIKVKNFDSENMVVSGTYTYDFSKGDFALSDEEGNAIGTFIDGGFYVKNFNTTINHWGGKKIVWMGTSIPWGQTWEGATAETGGQCEHPYPSIVAEMLSCVVDNTSTGGKAIETTSDYGYKTYGSFSLSKQEYINKGLTNPPEEWCYDTAMLGKNADLYVFDVEPNNSVSGIELLDNFDVWTWKYNDNSTFESHRNTFVGAFLFLLDKLWTENPYARVVMVGEYHPLNNDNYAIRDAAKAISEKLRIHYIDIWSKMYYNGKTRDANFTNDNIHPNQAAYYRIGKMIANELLLIC